MYIVSQAKELSDTKKKLEETKTELFQVQEQFQQKKYEDEKMIKRLRNTVADKYVFCSCRAHFYSREDAFLVRNFFPTESK